MYSVTGKDLARFWAKVDKNDPSGCWMWRSRRNKKGYGLLDFGHTPVRAHRLSWFIQHGKLSEDLCVLHRCDNPPCVNPDHLFLGTVADNNLDLAAKGRHGHAKLSECDVREIIRLIRAKESYGYIAHHFNVSGAVISDIACGKAWKHVTGGRIRDEHGSAKLSTKDVLDIRSLATSGLRQSEISRHLDIPHSTISGIIRGVAWKHLLPEAPAA